MNRVMIAGRITNKPQQNQTKEGHEFSAFTIAIPRLVHSKTNNQQAQVDYVPCMAWDKKAEYVNKYLNKGIMVLIEGEYHSYKKTNKEGIKENANVIKVEKIKCLEPRKLIEKGILIKPENEAQTKIEDNNEYVSKYSFSRPTPPQEEQEDDNSLEWDL
ncbi:single-stranded DNA-binding protein [Mycoplasma sp. 125]|uniref:single-stranded DNA-binding protein n=1 Tax=Mycoplasma sp. 125 TaxID=3447505 RepID=UPI003F65A428